MDRSKIEQKNRMLKVAIEYKLLCRRYQADTTIPNKWFQYREASLKLEAECHDHVANELDYVPSSARYIIPSLLRGFGGEGPESGYGKTAPIDSWGLGFPGSPPCSGRGKRGSGTQCGREGGVYRGVHLCWTPRLVSKTAAILTKEECASHLTSTVHS